MNRYNFKNFISLAYFNHHRPLPSPPPPPPKRKNLEGAAPIYFLQNNWNTTDFTRGVYISYNLIILEKIIHRKKIYHQIYVKIPKIRKF